MVLVAPDILNEVRQLPWYFLAIGLALGLLLWLFGGRGHRFWLVLGLTVAGGVLGLRFGAAYEVQPLVAGLLLAVTAGALALALSRVLLFVAGGAACVALAHAVAPSFDEPAVCFLVGGLLGVLLYKVWVSALSSLAGTLLIAYSILGLLSRFHLVRRGRLGGAANAAAHLGLRGVRGARSAGPVPAGAAAAAPATREGRRRQRGG